MEKRLYRSRDDRLIFGVCGGLAKYFNIDPVIVRIIAVLLVLASNGAGVIAYIIMAIVVPLESSQVSEPRDVIKENVEEMRQRASQIGDEIRSTLAKKGAPEEMAKTRQRGYNVLGIILIIVGIIFLLATFRLFWWLRWVYLWPFIFVAIGLLIIFGSRRK